MSYIKVKGSDPATQQAGWDFFLGDLEELAGGIDPDGVPFAEDNDGTIWSGCPLFGKPDCEQLVAWGGQSYNSADEVCSWCLANRTDRPYTDNLASAAWRATEHFSNRDFLARIDSRHPLANCIHVHRHFVRADAIHIVDHNGLSCIVIGSVISRLVKYEPRLGRNQDAWLETLNAEIDEYWSTVSNPSSSNPIRNLKMSNISPDGKKQWSVLKGPRVKSANTRQFVPVLEVLVRKYCDRGNLEDLATVKLVVNINKMYHIMYSAGIFFTPAQHNAFSDAVLEVGTAIQFLRSVSNRRGDLFYQITPKVHFVQHLPFQASAINPRYTQNYCEESLVGKICKIWKSCAEGPYARTVQRTTLIKWLVLFACTYDL